MRSELKEFLDRIHKAGYTLDSLKENGVQRDDAQNMCVLLVDLVSAMLRRVSEIEESIEEIEYLEYLAAMNYAMFFELGFTDADIAELNKQNADPCQVAIQRIRDLKAAKTNTVH